VPKASDILRLWGGREEGVTKSAKNSGFGTLGDEKTSIINSLLEKGFLGKGVP